MPMRTQAPASPSQHDVVVRFARALLFAILLTPMQSGPVLAAPKSAPGDQMAADSDYQLGALDQIRIKIVAWRAARDEVFEWKAINGDYTVGAAGKVSLPLIGEIVASGATTSDLADLIADRLQERIGLAHKPDASVEVVKFRPFYIVGDVANPGEYSYRPAMNVLQALSIAGGLPRSYDLDAQRIEREIIGWVGELRELSTERMTLLAKRARLEAELNGRDDVAFPSSLAHDAGELGQTLIAQEKLIFRTRQEALKLQTQSLEQLKNYLTGTSTPSGLKSDTKRSFLDWRSRISGTLKATIPVVS